MPVRGASFFLTEYLLKRMQNLHKKIGLPQMCSILTLKLESRLLNSRTFVHKLQIRMILAARRLECDFCAA